MDPCVGSAPVHVAPSLVLLVAADLPGIDSVPRTCALETFNSFAGRSFLAASAAAEFQVLVWISSYVPTPSSFCR